MMLGKYFKAAPCKKKKIKNKDKAHMETELD